MATSPTTLRRSRPVRPDMPTGSILVADDDAAIRTVLNQALSRAGYEVRSTGNAATLWRWISARGRRSGDHRRGHAGRKCIRSHPAHPQGASRSADHGDERAEHIHDGDPRVGARRLRISAETFRSQGTDLDRRARVVGAEGAAAGDRRRTKTSREFRSSAGRRRCRRSTVFSRG